MKRFIFCKYFLFILIIGKNFNLFSMKQDLSIAIPVAVHPDDKIIKILLGLHYDNVWRVFSQLFSKNRANQVGLEVLESQTNGVYNKNNVQFYQIPWTQEITTSGTKIFVHFFPVQFIGGRFLFPKRNTKFLKDIAWVDPEEIKKGLFKNQKIDEFLVNFLKKDWDEGNRFKFKLYDFYHLPISFKALPYQQPQAIQQQFIQQQQLQQTSQSLHLPQQQQQAIPVQYQKNQHILLSIGGIKLNNWLTNQNTGMPFQNIYGTILYGNPDFIYFYKKGEVYYEFTNFYEKDQRPLFISQGIPWKTSENYFQAMKTNDQNVWKHLASVSPREAFNFFRNQKNKGYYIGDTLWHGEHGNPGRKHKAMLEALRAKFDQNPELKNLLIETNKKIIVENTFLADYNDDEWGNGLEGNGKNLLGRMLMHIRAEFLGIIPKNSEFPYTGNL